LIIDYLFRWEIAGFVFYLSGFVGKMFWWTVLFAIRGILIFERFASRGVILGNGPSTLFRTGLTWLDSMGSVNHRYPPARAQVSRKVRGSRNPETEPALSLISAEFF